MHILPPKCVKLNLGNIDIVIGQSVVRGCRHCLASVVKNRFLKIISNFEKQNAVNTQY